MRTIKFNTLYSIKISKSTVGGETYHLVYFVCKGNNVTTGVVAQERELTKAIARFVQQYHSILLMEFGSRGWLVDGEFEQAKYSLGLVK